jgi:hypothetical protein
MFGYKNNIRNEFKPLFIMQLISKTNELMVWKKNYKNEEMI